MSNVCTKKENPYQSGGVVNVRYVRTGSNALDGGQANPTIL